MRIAVVGLGYVGAVSTACLAERGHTVVGVDVDPEKVRLIHEGGSPVGEPGVAERLSRAKDTGAVRATTDCEAAIDATDIAWICVGTPSAPNGAVDTSHVRHVGEQIGAALRDRTDPYLVVLRSTVLPGTTAETLIPALQRGGGFSELPQRISVCFHPEFLREGRGVKDFDDPARILIGAESGPLVRPLVDLYADMPASVMVTSIRAAEMAKYADNAWHALKVSFANEIGSVAKRMGLDGREVMRIFCMDEKLNLSSQYLTPGLSFGGSCLPKDVRALNHAALELGLHLPTLASVLPSNRQHLERGLRLILEQDADRIGLAGLSFKPGTDDLRESPLVDLAARLLDGGYDLRIYDPSVQPGRLHGSNLRFAEERISDLESVLVSTKEELLAHAEILVIGHRDGILDGPGTIGGDGPIIIDLAGGFDATDVARYHGICW